MSSRGSEEGRGGKGEGGRAAAAAAAGTVSSMFGCASIIVPRPCLCGLVIVECWNEVVWRKEEKEASASPVPWIEAW